MSEGLFEINEIPATKAGRHENALRKAIDAAEANGIIEQIDQGLISAATAAAFALDRAEKMNNAPYAIAAIIAPYSELLRELRMTPSTRLEEANDDFADAIRELNQTSFTEIRDTTTSGE